METFLDLRMIASSPNSLFTMNRASLIEGAVYFLIRIFQPHPSHRLHPHIGGDLVVR